MVINDSIFEQQYFVVGGSVQRSYIRDDGRFLGAGLQEQASNHLNLLSSNARVVRVKEKTP